METVNLFWDNQPLKNINRLCILTLAEYNNKVNVFTYKPDLFKSYSDIINVHNANEIVEEKDKFYYSGNGDCYNRSVVGFSDLFRYKLLRKVGGWYFDFDTITLKPFSTELIERETVIRPHFTYKAVCNICKFNKDHPVLDELYCETKKQVTEENNKWSLPIEIFYKIIEKNHLNNQIVDKSYFGDDNYNFIRNILFQKYDTLNLDTYYALHICNTFLSSGIWGPTLLYNVNAPKNLTLLHFLYKKYKLL